MRYDADVSYLFFLSFWKYRRYCAIITKAERKILRASLCSAAPFLEVHWKLPLFSRMTMPLSWAFIPNCNVIFFGRKNKFFLALQCDLKVLRIWIILNVLIWNISSCDIYKSMFSINYTEQKIEHGRTRNWTSAWSTNKSLRREYKSGVHLVKVSCFLLKPGVGFKKVRGQF